MTEPTEYPLKLTATGPGSRAEIAAYIQQVITQRTTPNDDTSAERLAHGITTSVLHRLGAGYSVAVGESGYSHPHDRAIMALTELPEETRRMIIELLQADRQRGEGGGR